MVAILSLWRSCRPAWGLTSILRSSAPGTNISEHGFGRALHKEISFVIPAKAPDCVKFNGQVKEFEPWKEKVMHHIASQATRRCRVLIENCLKAQHPIRKSELLTTVGSGFNAWEIATEGKPSLSAS